MPDNFYRMFQRQFANTLNSIDEERIVMAIRAYSIIIKFLDQIFGLIKQ